MLLPARIHAPHSHLVSSALNTSPLYLHMYAYNGQVDKVNMYKTCVRHRRMQ